MTDITERLRQVCETGCDPDLPYEAADEIERLRARVAELEAARGEPVAWMNPYGGTLQVRITGLEYEKYTIPLYTAHPAPSSALLRTLDDR